MRSRYIGKVALAMFIFVAALIYFRIAIIPTVSVLTASIVSPWLKEVAAFAAATNLLGILWLLSMTRQLIVTIRQPTAARVHETLAEVLFVSFLLLCSLGAVLVWLLNSPG